MPQIDEKVQNGIDGTKQDKLPKQELNAQNEEATNLYSPFRNKS